MNPWACLLMASCLGVAGVTVLFLLVNPLTGWLRLAWDVCLYRRLHDVAETHIDMEYFDWRDFRRDASSYRLLRGIK